MPVRVDVTHFQHAVALGLIDLAIVYPDEISFGVIQGPVVA
jgi:hypothetical protein